MSGEVEAARVRQRQEARAEDLASAGTDEALETLVSNGYGNVGARGLLFLADREGLYTDGPVTVEADSLKPGRYAVTVAPAAAVPLTSAQRPNRVILGCLVALLVYLLVFG